MEQAVSLGLAHHIGIANFDSLQLAALLDEETSAHAPLRVRPSILQLEYQPRHHDERLRAHATAHGIVLVAYGPLRATVDGEPSSRRRAKEMDSLRAVAERRNVSSERIALAWLVAQGVAAIPRSTSVAHLAENLAAGFVTTDAAQALVSGSLPVDAVAVDAGAGAAALAPLRLSSSEIDAVSSAKRLHRYARLAAEMADKRPAH
jgi:alcohol dehydrogenase (NADP+)